jgi:hypothetical protein
MAEACPVGSEVLGVSAEEFSMSVNAFHENAVYVKSESAILMLFSMLSFLKPTFLS